MGNTPAKPLRGSGTSGKPVNSFVALNNAPLVTESEKIAGKALGVHADKGVSPKGQPAPTPVAAGVSKSLGKKDAGATKIRGGAGY